jgi:hypothetical protein
MIALLWFGGQRWILVGRGIGWLGTYNATSEPMLIRDKRMMSTAVRRTALRGTSSEGSTFAIQLEKGSPSSRANWNNG